LPYILFALHKENHVGKDFRIKSSFEKQTIRNPALLAFLTKFILNQIPALLIINVLSMIPWRRPFYPDPLA
jgi:hypothetical protein